MIRRRAICLAFLLACLAWLAALPAGAQPKQDSVQVILSNPNSRASLRNSVRPGAYDAIKRRAGRVSVRVLPLTKTEIWSVPRANVAAVLAST